ncbi:MAG: hypothetical protein AAGF07_01270 [Patescibacteria group bacterium]
MTESLNEIKATPSKELIRRLKSHLRYPKEIVPNIDEIIIGISNQANSKNEAGRRKRLKWTGGEFYTAAQVEQILPIAQEVKSLYQARGEQQVNLDINENTLKFLNLFVFLESKGADYEAPKLIKDILASLVSYEQDSKRVNKNSKAFKYNASVSLFPIYELLWDNSKEIEELKTKYNKFWNNDGISILNIFNSCKEQQFVDQLQNISLKASEILENIKLSQDNYKYLYELIYTPIKSLDNSLKESVNNLNDNLVLAEKGFDVETLKYNSLKIGNTVDEIINSGFSPEKYLLSDLFSRGIRNVELSKIFTINTMNCNAVGTESLVEQGHLKMLRDKLVYIIHFLQVTNSSQKIGLDAISLDQVNQACGLYHQELANRAKLNRLKSMQNSD